MQQTWNAYETRFFVTTVKRANIEGQKYPRQYGYVIRCFPKAPWQTSQVYAWCKTKAIALAALERCENSKKQGYWECPCGSGKQARLCCGIPNQKEPTL